MATTAQIKRGLGTYIDSEILPKIPGGTFKKIAVGTALGLFLDNVDKMFDGEDGMLVSLLGIRDRDEIDVHKISEHLKANMPEEGIKIDLKIMGMRLGDMTLYRRDIDDIVRHIVTA